MAQVLLAGEAGVDDVDRPAEPPAVQVVLDLLDDRLVVGVAGPDPAAHRDPLPGDREADHDLRQVGTVILGVTQSPQRPFIPAASPACCPSSSSSGVCSSGSVSK